ncbi:type II secretion system protein GspL [Enterobacterales bacterium BD_CKDN230030183-1A_HGKHYDSX7]
MSTLLRRYSALLLRYRLHAQARWRHSVLRQWLLAWRDELLGMLPRALAERIGRRDAIQLLCWPLPQRCQTNRPALLMLAEHQVMRQHISLPLAAARNLNEVIAYEIDKYTPYPADQVHFVARVLQRQPQHADIELVAIAHTALAAMLQDCRARGLQLLAVDVMGRDQKPLGIDLLPAGSDTLRSSPGSLNRWLWLGCILGVVALATAYVDRRQATIAFMQQTVDTQRQAVREVEQLRQTLDTTVGAEHYLAGLRTQRPTATALLADLSTCLGDDTWVDRLQLEDGVQLTLSGQSTHASDLLKAMRHCQTLEHPRFQGVILADKTTGHDRFAISAQLKEASHAPAQP